MAGMHTRPIITTEAPIIPTVVARSIPISAVAMAIPPRTGPNIIWMVLSRSPANPDRSSISPMYINKGTAIRTWFDMIAKVRNTLILRKAGSRPPAKAKRRETTASPKGRGVACEESRKHGEQHGYTKHPVR